MKIASFGWESDKINNHTVTITYPIIKPITIIGYQFDMGLMSWDAGQSMFQGGGWTEVLFSATINTLPAPTEFGTPVFTDATGTKQNLHGNAMNGVNFSSAIVKGFVSNIDTVNKDIRMMGLNLPVAANSELIFNAGHAGYGPVDFEVQGVIFYE